MEQTNAGLIESLKNLGSEHKVPNLDRGMTVLELLHIHSDGLGISDIAQMMEWPKNSTMRVAMALESRGFLTRDPISKRFFLSRKLFQFGVSTTGFPNLAVQSFDVMCSLRDFVGETILLGTMADGYGVVLEQVLSKHAFKFQIDVGTRFELHAAAPGKAMLAHLPEKELKELIKLLDFKQYNERTIANEKQLREEMQLIRERGYSEDHAEMIEGCHCISVPILNQIGYPIAAIWATGPSNRLTAEHFESAGKEMYRQVKQLSEQLVL